MCGIVGYTGSQDAIERLLLGLHRLEYRGYDSAGLAALTQGAACDPQGCGTSRTASENSEGETPLQLPRALLIRGGPRMVRPPSPMPIPISLTMGDLPSCITGLLKITLRCGLISRASGIAFQSETDTEVLAHLIAEMAEKTERFRRGRPAGSAGMPGHVRTGGALCGRTGHDRRRPPGSPLAIGIGREGVLGRVRSRSTCRPGSTSGLFGR